jgi:hypothetical protein
VVTNVAWFLISAVALLRMRSRTEAAVAEPEPMTAPALATMDPAGWDTGGWDTGARDSITDTAAQMVIPRPSQAVNCA